MSMIVNFRDIVDAFDFVNFASMHEHEAYLNVATGQIFCHSELADGPDELPADVDDEKYIAIPHKNELGLGKNLVLAFAYEHLPLEAHDVESMFMRKGAYASFKALLESKGCLDQWYEFEAQAQAKALRKWCDENEIKTHD